MAELITCFGIFNTQEIVVQSLRVNTPKTTEILKVENQHEYNILCSNKGVFRVFCSGNSFDLTPGDIFIAMPFENFYVVYVDNKTEFKSYDRPIISKITFASNTFDDIIGDSKYLRAFNNRKKGKNCYYKKEYFDKIIQPIDIFKTLKSYVDNNFGLVHFSSTIGTLISILDITYDKKYGGLNSINSDEYEVKIWDYILNNCLSKITAEDVEKEFNVSKWYLDKVTNRFYGMPFHKTINALRMWRAKNLMKENVPLYKVANLCGFANYSTFYRGYTKFFGINPKEDYKYFEKNSIYYSDDASKKGNV